MYIIYVDRRKVDNKILTLGKTNDEKYPNINIHSQTG